jgi:heterotetrameric sarcosine oxidase delta subunit
MRIPCPFCGPRDVAEFSYQGDASRTRPDPASTDAQAWADHVYNRANPRSTTMAAEPILSSSATRPAMRS